jgi:glycerol-3-phosphate dehydrogenase
VIASGTASGTEPATRIGAGLAGLPEDVDVVVAGLGVTGAGVALDAASRGLRVLAVDAHDLAFGTSRWSSKLVHGGLRYLAQGHLGIAHESAVERGILMQVTAPHLTHAVPMLIPLTPAVSRLDAAVATAGLHAGDLLRRSAHTDRETLPRPRRVSATETLQLAPGLRRAGLRGGLLCWDGRLEDDARLVVTIARTAATHGAHLRTRVRVLHAGAGPDSVVVLRDELTGETRTIRARAVVNATGVWAAGLAPEVTLRPSRGSHLVLRAGTLPDLRVVVTVPVPGAAHRFVMVLPQPDGTHYVGLTDEPVDGPVPDVPTASELEIGFLLAVVSEAFERPLRRRDVAGTYAGLRPLLDTGDGSTADLSRRHAVITSATGPTTMITVVGGKLTTYRRMAQDAVDAVVAATSLPAGPCRTRSLPLAGAASRTRLAALEGPPRLVRRYGTDADLVLATARRVTGLGDDELLAPVAEDVPTCLAELVFGVTHEGAVDADDLLDRRTRVGLIPADRERALPAARRALAIAGAMNLPVDPGR